MSFSAQLMRVRRVLSLGNAADWQKVLAFIVVWTSAVVFALSNITVSNVQQPPLWTRPDYDLRLGYTYSLMILLLPLASLVWWYRLSVKHDHDGRLKTLVRASVVGVAASALVLVLFDAMFASLLFAFPDPNAVIGLYFPGYEWAGNCSTLWQIFRPSCYARTIPVEEIAFYVSGSAVLRGMYLWASEDFFVLYTMKPEEYDREARHVKRLLNWNGWLVALVLGVLAFGFYLKQHHGGGYPAYLMLQALIIALPLVFLYTGVRGFMNTRALLLVLVLQILVSIIWEVTGALPYGWWGYKPAGMIGVHVPPWSDLPIEACLFWILVGWAATFAQEATKIKVRSHRSWRSILFGDSRP